MVSFVPPFRQSTDHRVLPEEEQLEFWKRSCYNLVADLDLYSQTLLSNLRRFQELGGSGSEVIRNWSINCLAHLAVLCETLSRMGPPWQKLEALCDSSLNRLGGLTQGMLTEEYFRLDLLLGVRALQ